MERTMSTRPTSPRPVAEQILWLRGREIETTPMHVLKLVYLCHGWCLGFTGEALINEPVEAWTYGPVVPTVYHLVLAREVSLFLAKLGSLALW